MFHPRAIEAANDLVKLWELKASKLEPGQIFEGSEDLMVSLTSLDNSKHTDACFPLDCSISRL
jgi:hypothetical protein